MTDTEFMDRAERLLLALETECDRLNEERDADLDSQRSGGMVTITFADRSQIVVNLQKPLQEVWLATRYGGYHYRWEEGNWVDTKGAGEFFERLSEDASRHAAQPLELRG